MLFRKAQYNAHVITAYNPSNSGMYTVDLAAENFLLLHGFTGNLLRVHMNPWKNTTRFGRQRFNRLKSSVQIATTTPIIYWGDFTTSPLYGLQEFTRRDIERRHSSNASEAFERWVDLFLRPNSKARENKVLSLGQNFQSINDVVAEMPTEQKKTVLNAYRSNFDTFLVRDPVSAVEMASLLSGGPAKVVEGLDPAFLLDDAREFASALAAPRSEEFCFFFGRSGLRNAGHLVERLKQATKMKAVELSKWLHLNKYDAHREVSEMMGKIKGANFVITDTYHLCVNALRLGVPVVCLGGDDLRQSSSLSDFKKKVLFSSFGISDWYISGLDDLSATHEITRILRVVDLCLERSYTSNLLEGVREKVDGFRGLASKVLCETISLPDAKS